MHHVPDGEAEAVAYLNFRIDRIETTIWGLACQLAEERGLPRPGLREVNEALDTLLGKRRRSDRDS